MSPSCFISVPDGIEAWSPFFIGHESPLQQSQEAFASVAAASPVLASLLFIGQESPLQQQQEAAAIVLSVFVRVYANATIAIAKTSSVATVNITFFLISNSIY
jgi:hypothetical protein